MHPPSVNRFPYPRRRSSGRLPRHFGKRALGRAGLISWRRPRRTESFGIDITQTSRLPELVAYQDALRGVLDVARTLSPATGLPLKLQTPATSSRDSRL